MEKAMLTFGAAAMFAGALILMLPFATLCGAVAGWVVGWFFGETILGTLSQAGLHNVTMWQLGATLGFTGGFLRTTVSQSKAKA